MPTRKRSKNTIRNRKTRRSMRTMILTIPMRPLNSTKRLSIPLGYFGSIQINRRSDNNGFDFIFDLVKKIRGGAKLMESSDSIQLVNDVMSYATQSIVRNIQEKLNNSNISKDRNSFFITKYLPTGEGPKEYMLTSKTTNNGDTFIQFKDFQKQSEYPIHISMFMESTDPNFLLQSTNNGHDTRYHITEDKDPSNKQHFNLEWHIELDTNKNNFYLRCELLNPKRNYSIDQYIALEIIQYINEALNSPENRISAVNINRDDMYKNDSKYMIILEKHNVKSVSELIGDTSTKHTMHERHMNKILNAGGLHSNLPRFNQAVETATAEYKAIIERLIQESKDNPDVKKYNEKKSQKDTLTESLNKVSFTENQQDHFFKILKDKQIELELEELKLAELEAELAKLEKLQPNEKDGGGKDDSDDDWMDAPLPEITLKTNEMTLKEKISKLEQEISESNKKILKLKQDIFNIIELNTEMQDDALKLFKQFNTQPKNKAKSVKSSTKIKGKN